MRWLKHSSGEILEITCVLEAELALQLTDKLVTWLCARQLINAGRAQQLAENSERSNARITKAMEARRNVGADDPGVHDPTGVIEAADRPICVLDFQVLGTGAGMICDGPDEPIAIDTACQTFEPISYSRTDTDETRQQIREHNAAWDALCKDKK